MKLIETPIEKEAWALASITFCHRTENGTSHQLIRLAKENPEGASKLLIALREEFIVILNEDKNDPYFDKVNNTPDRRREFRVPKLKEHIISDMAQDMHNLTQDEKEAFINGMEETVKDLLPLSHMELRGIVLEILKSLPGDQYRPDVVSQTLEVIKICVEEVCDKKKVDKKISTAEAIEITRKAMEMQMKIIDSLPVNSGGHTVH